MERGPSYCNSVSNLEESMSFLSLLELAYLWIIWMVYWFHWAPCNFPFLLWWCCMGMEHLLLGFLTDGSWLLEIPAADHHILSLFWVASSNKKGLSIAGNPFNPSAVKKVQVSFTKSVFSEWKKGEKLTYVYGHCDSSSPIFSDKIQEP